MENRLARPAPEAFPSGSPAEGWRAAAPGRLAEAHPVAIIDIGSNSVRLVVYEAHSRAPTPIFNEKEMAGLGRNVATSGELSQGAITKALGALDRFRILCEAMGVDDVRVLATAAARDARNGPAFIAEAERTVGRRIELVSGDREAYLSAMGVVSGFEEPDGIVGDLGGGSLELVDVSGERIGTGVSVKLGGLALLDRAGGSIKQAEKIAREELSNLPQIEAMRGRIFYAVGGTWRALAKLHQRQTNYPLSVMHAYTVPARDAADFARLVERVDADILDSIDSVSSARRPLLAYGALVLEQLIRRGKPKSLVISAQGVREGLLHDKLAAGERSVDPLLQMVEQYNYLRSRDPRHAADLTGWIEGFMASTGLEESRQERRLRLAACLLADIGWRAHPDYRGEQSLNVIAHAAFIGVDHPGRAFLALTVFHRYAGLKDEGASARLREVLSSPMLERARVIGSAMRLAFLLSAAMPSILPRLPLACLDGKLELRVPRELHSLASERVAGRLKTLAKLVGREPRIVVEG